jgi:hypothetical protein
VTPSDTVSTESPPVLSCLPHLPVMAPPRTRPKIETVAWLAGTETVFQASVSTWERVPRVSNRAGVVNLNYPWWRDMWLRAGVPIRENVRDVLSVGKPKAAPRVASIGAAPGRRQDGARMWCPGSRYATATNRSPLKVEARQTGRCICWIQRHPRRTRVQPCTETWHLVPSWPCVVGSADLVTVNGPAPERGRSPRRVP